MRADLADWLDDGLCYSVSQAKQWELAVKILNGKKSSWAHFSELGRGRRYLVTSSPFPRLRDRDQLELHHLARQERKRSKLKWLLRPLMSTLGLAWNRLSCLGCNMHNNLLLKAGGSSFLLIISFNELGLYRNEIFLTCTIIQNSSGPEFCTAYPRNE